MKPNTLKFRAWYKGKLLEEGDYWAPRIKNPSPDNCYKIKISSAGIHYCSRITTAEEEFVIVRKGEKTDMYYKEFEEDKIWVNDVELEIIGQPER